LKRNAAACICKRGTQAPRGERNIVFGAATNNAAARGTGYPHRPRARRIIEITPDPLRLSDVFRELWNARLLLLYFTARDLKSRYRGAWLGNWWTVIRPVIEMLPYIIVFGLFLKLRPTAFPYLVYLLSGFAPWLLFGNTVNGATRTLARARSLVSKVYFPRLIVPLSELIVRSIDFAVVLVAAMIAALAYGIVPAINLWALPIFTLMLLMLAFATGLIVTTICTIHPHLAYGIPPGTRLLFYLSPVIYPLEIVPEALRPWYKLNPLTTVISGIRWSLFGIDQPSPLEVSLAAAVTLIVLWMGLYMFLRLERRVTDIL
jgi:lipopolysaccharide transport system permease protein